MQYEPVVSRVALPVAIDPLWLTLFTIAFVGVALATQRKPAVGVAALIVAQPFAGAHYLFATTVTLPKVVLLGVVVGLLSQSLDALRAPRVRAVLIALVAYTIVVAATIAVAAYRGPSVRETFKWVEYAALFAAVAVAYDRDPDDALLVRCWCGVTLLVCALALIQEAIGAPSGLYVNNLVVPRIAGPLEGPNQLAGYLESSLAVLCAWYRKERWMAPAIAVAVATLALTFSRGGITGAAIAVAAVIVFSPARRLLGAPLIVGAAAGAASVAGWIGLTRSGTFAILHTGALLQAPRIVYSGGVGYRGELWRAALALWRSNPLLGVGAGNYELLLGRVGISGVRTHANSWYLQSLAEGGIALFAATLALAVTLLRTLAQKLSEAGPWQIAAFAASLALLVHQVVDYMVFYPKVGGPWWILVALGASAIRRSSPRRSSLRSASAAPSGAA